MTKFGKRSFYVWHRALVACIVGLLLPSVLWAQGVIDNPAPGSVQSGAGLITGWTCEAEEVLVFIDEFPPLAAAYGTTRADTAGVCGDDNNGYGLTFNWNLVGEGLHRVRIEVDGVELGRVAFLVSTLGPEEFVTGLAADATVIDFPTEAATVEIQWQESQQNFVLSAETDDPGSGSGGAPPAILDNPQPGSFQSGIGLIAGWVCEVLDEVLIRIDDLSPLRAAYGTTRADTAELCNDDGLNGYGLTFNWNLVGPGEHTLRASADGFEFANLTFTVTTLNLGQEFPQGLEDLASALGTVLNFPVAGTDIRVRWQDAHQNFSLEGILPPGRDAALCTTEEGEAIDPAGLSATFRFTNICSLNGEEARMDVTIPLQSAQQGNTLRNALLGQAKTDGFELCIDLMSFVQDGNEIQASDFSFVDGQGDEVCRTLAPGETLRTLIVAPPGSPLDFGHPFQLHYNAMPVVDFSDTATPQLSVSQTPIDFGTVEVGEFNSVTRTLTITNQGTGTLTGNAETAAPFSIVAGGSFSLAAGGSQTLTLRFRPTDTGLFSEELRITSNGGNATINLEGEGTDRDPQLSVSSNSLDFGTSAGSTQSVTVTNTGGGTLTGNASTSSPFSLTSGGSFSLDAGQDQAITVRFNPNGGGPYTENLNISSNGGSASVSLSGTTPAQITVSQTSLDFGNVPIGSTSDRSVTVTNIGGSSTTAQLGNLVSPPFSIVSASSFTLAPGESEAITIRFSPTQAVPSTATLFLGSGASVSLSGTGVRQ